MSSFFEGSALKWLARSMPGHRFHFRRSVDGSFWLVSDIDTGRMCNIPERMVGSAIRTAEGVAEVARLLDDAFDDRNPTEKLPWQLFALPP